MRAFIAIEVPQDIAANAAKVQPELPQDAVKLAQEGKMHLTLRFLGNDVKDEQVPAIKEAISSIKFEPFAVECKGIGVFPNPHYIRVVWAGIDSGGRLEAISKELNEKLVPLGFETEPFTSHLTIARVRRRIDLSDFISKHKDDVFGEFAVKQGDVRLKRSQFTSGGAVYTNL
ncbi:RNA 2',3'-cyclic phosphodiesterase [uncultured archaeon]|nr:RNA 2',3'-cyclic phosphodiesterase [uncultured archaeon]